LLGIAHTSLTPLFFNTMNDSFLWFAGTGYSFVFFGFLNISRLKIKASLIIIFCIIGNSLALLFCPLLMVSFIVVMKEGTLFQLLISLIDLLLLLIFSVYDLKSFKEAVLQTV